MSMIFEGQWRHQDAEINRKARPEEWASNHPMSNIINWLYTQPGTNTVYRLIGRWFQTPDAGTHNIMWQHGYNWFGVADSLPKGEQTIIRKWAKTQGLEEMQEYF